VPYAYGNLSVEARHPPPRADQPLRQPGPPPDVSFAAVEVVPLIEQTDHIEIPENELKVDVFRSSGPGGRASTPPTRPCG
jgi:peptide chain release factor 2